MTENIKSLKLSIPLPTLSVNIIVKDEEFNLNTLLPSIDGIVDEIVIVDTGSTDKTVDVINKNIKNTKYKILFQEWEDDFSKPRNLALQNSSSDYILWLDADDSIKRDDIYKIKTHLLKYINTYVYLHLVDSRFNSMLHSMQLRVFPNIKNIEFRHKVHEQIIYSLNELGIKSSFLSEAKIIHKGYSSEKELIQKLIRNYKILAKEILTEDADFYTFLNHARTSMSLSKLNEAERYIDKAISIYKKGNENIVEEFIVLAYSIKANLYGSKNEHKKSLNLLKEIEEKFPNNLNLKLLLGEIYYKLTNYYGAYTYLCIILEKSFNIGLLPVDLNKVLSTLLNYLLISSLAIGDFNIAERTVQEISKDFGFRIRRN